MNCRNHQTRIKIARDYKINVIVHLKVLNGETIKSDAGGDITDSYVVFECENIENGEKERICCGVPSAKDLCLLAKKDMPELFNPLKSEIQDQNDILTNDTTKDSINRKKWNPTAKQLYNAIMFFFYRFGIDPDKPLFKVKSRLANGS